LPARHSSHHVEQENKQIVRLARSCCERFFVDNFEVNQSRAITGRIVDHILAGAITVRPAAPELVTPKLVRAAKFTGCGLQHSSR